jgi:hypothetical protein
VALPFPIRISLLGIGAGLIATPSCATGEKADPSQVSADAGTPEGYAACSATFFGNYLKTCSVSADCGGILVCDNLKKFGETPRCHARECALDTECENAFKTLCNGGDFHYVCERSNPLVPTECHIEQGAPAP